MDNNIQNLTKNATFNPQTQDLTVYNDVRRLTTKEALLLSLFLQNVNTLVEREKALSQIWGKTDYFASRSMDVYITHLRKHLKPVKEVEIMNVRGKGYKMIIDNGAAEQ